MSAPTPWRILREEMNASLDRFCAAQAAVTGRLHMEVRLAVMRYGKEVDPDSFDQYGMPIEPEEAED